MDNEIKLRYVIASVFQIDAAAINEDSSVDSIEAWDSLTHLNLVLALEQEFDVSLTEEEAVEILNFALIKITLAEHGVKFI